MNAKMQSIFGSPSNVDYSWKKITLHFWEELHHNFCLCEYVQADIHLTLMFAANPKLINVLWLIIMLLQIYKIGVSGFHEVWPSANSFSHGHIKETVYFYLEIWNIPWLQWDLKGEI